MNNGRLNMNDKNNNLFIVRLTYYIPSYNKYTYPFI